MVECQLPKLDAVGSNPISRSIFSITCRELRIRDSLVFEVTGYLAALEIVDKSVLEQIDMQRSALAFVPTDLRNQTLGSRTGLKVLAIARL